MISISRDVQDYILFRKVENLLLNRDDKKYVFSKLVKVKGWYKNFLPYTDMTWEGTMLLVTTGYTSRPFFLHTQKLNEHSLNYCFDLVWLLKPGAIQEVKSHKDEEPILGFYIKTRTRHTLELDKTKLKLLKPISVNIMRHDVLTYDELEELSLVEQNLNLINFSKIDIEECFMPDHLLTEDYNAEKGLGKISRVPKKRLGWSLYRV